MNVRPKRVVFLIDADEETRVTHETILRAEGYEILSARDGARALPLLREQTPALVLMASKIGPLPPLQLTRVLRADSALRDVKVAVYAPRGGAEKRDDLLRAGVDAFLTLPLTPQRLVREVVVLIGRP